MNLVKLFFCDVETTGLDPARNGITQIAGEIGYLRPDGTRHENGVQLQLRRSVRTWLKITLDIQKKTPRR